MAFTENMYEAELARYYDLMHQHRDYEKESMFANNIIQKYYPEAKQILDICCGTGEHAIKMAQLGYEVTGIDASHDMIKLAQEKTKRADISIKFKRTDINNLNIMNEFQAAYCLGYTFHYMTTYSDVTNFLNTVNSALLPQGVFMVDFINPWGLIEGIRKDKFTYQHEGAKIFQFEQASLDKERRIRHIEFYYLIDSQDGHAKTIFAEEDLRIFFEDEVQMLLSSCGFESIQLFGDYDSDKEKSGVSNIVIVAGKKKE